MGNDMFNEEQLAYAAEQQASRERNSPPAYILSREAFLRKLNILADTRPSNDGPIPSEVDLSAHDIALRAENERLREALRHAARELVYVHMHEEVGGPDLVHTSEGDAVIALSEKLLGPMATWPEEPNAGQRAFLAGGKP